LKNKEGLLIQHFGKYESDKQFNEDDSIEMSIDEAMRKSLVKLHSTGHLVDLALKNMGFDKWTGTVFPF
jgi:Ser-tRNA(Ala) deacylase AlaX